MSENQKIIQCLKIEKMSTLKVVLTSLEKGSDDSCHKKLSLVAHFEFLELWWLSSTVRFKYKPGYRPCDLL